MAEQSQKPNQGLNYQVPMRITYDDINVLRRAFKDNDPLMKVMVKIFLPSQVDPEMPIEYYIDIWSDRDYSAIPSEELKPLVVARQDMIKYIKGSLMQIKNFANSPEELTPEQLSDKMAKDSGK